MRKEQSAPGLTEIYHPSRAPEPLQEPQMRPFNWTDLADQKSLCQPAALEE